LESRKKKLIWGVRAAEEELASADKDIIFFRRAEKSLEGKIADLVHICTNTRVDKAAQDLQALLSTISTLDISTMAKQNDMRHVINDIDEKTLSESVDLITSVFSDDTLLASLDLGDDVTQESGQPNSLKFNSGGDAKLQIEMDMSKDGGETNETITMDHNLKRKASFSVDNLSSIIRVRSQNLKEFINVQKYHSGNIKQENSPKIEPRIQEEVIVESRDLEGKVNNADVGPAESGNTISIQEADPIEDAIEMIIKLEKEMNMLKLKFEQQMNIQLTITTTDTTVEANEMKTNVRTGRYMAVSGPFHGAGSFDNDDDDVINTVQNEDLTSSSNWQSADSSSRRGGVGKMSKKRTRKFKHRWSPGKTLIGLKVLYFESIEIYLENFKEILTEIPPKYRCKLALALPELLELIEQLYTEKMHVDEMMDVSHKPRMQMHTFLFDFFLMRNGISQTAKLTLSDFLGSCFVNANSLKVSTFLRFCGVSHGSPPLPREALDFFLCARFLLLHNSTTKKDQLNISDKDLEENIILDGMVNLVRTEDGKIYQLFDDVKASVEIVFQKIGNQGRGTMIEDLEQLSCTMKTLSGTEDYAKMISLDDAMLVLMIQWVNANNHDNAKLHQLFLIGDSNGDGCLSFDEFHSIVSSIDPDRNTYEISRMYSEALRKTNGGIVDPKLFAEIARQNQIGVTWRLEDLQKMVNEMKQNPLLEEDRPNTSDTDTGDPFVLLEDTWLSSQSGVESTMEKIKKVISSDDFASDMGKNEFICHSQDSQEPSSYSSAKDYAIWDKCPVFELTPGFTTCVDHCDMKQRLLEGTSIFNGTSSYARFMNQDEKFLQEFSIIFEFQTYLDDWPASSGFSISDDNVGNVPNDDYGHIKSWYVGHGIVDAEACGALGGFGISIGGGKVMFGVEEVTIISEGSYADGQWHVVLAVQKNNGDMHLYIDGKLAESAQGNSKLSGTLKHLAIGCNQKAQSYFKGMMRNFRVYAEAANYDSIGNLEPDRSIRDLLTSSSDNESDSGGTFSKEEQEEFNKCMACHKKFIEFFEQRSDAEGAWDSFQEFMLQVQYCNNLLEKLDRVFISPSSKICSMIMFQQHQDGLEIETD
jgi:hypothetical protein